MPGTRALLIPLAAYLPAWLLGLVAVFVGGLQEPVIEMDEVLFFGQWIAIGAIAWLWVFGVYRAVKTQHRWARPLIAVRAVVAVPTMILSLMIGGFVIVMSSFSLTGRTPENATEMAVLASLAALAVVVCESAIVVAAVQVFRAPKPQAS